MTEKKRLRSLRSDYARERNGNFYKLKEKAGLSYNEIASSPEYNPNGLSVQRIQQIVKEYKNLFAAKKDKDEAKA